MKRIKLYVIIIVATIFMLKNGFYVMATQIDTVSQNYVLENDIVIETMLIEADGINTDKIKAEAEESGAEKNGKSYLTATHMELNKTCHGSTYDATELWENSDSYFKFVLPANGVISISMSHDLYESSGEGWYLSMYDSKYEAVYGMYSSIGYEHLKKSPQIGLPAGTYYIVVSDRGAHNSDQFEFDLCINYVKTNNWETEYNNNWLSADGIVTGTTYSGVTLDYGEDDYEGDYYKFDLPYMCLLRVNFWHELYDSGDTWDIELYDSNRKRITQFYSTDGYSQSKKTEEILLEKGTYYLVISGNYYSDEVPYHFSVICQPAIGTVTTYKNVIYKVVKNGYDCSMQCIGPVNKNITSATISSKVSVNGFKYPVTKITVGAFKNCKKLQKIVIGDNIKSIDKSAFYGCKKLKTITIKSKRITSIKSKAFKGIYKKAKINVPNSKKTKYKKLLKKAGVKSSAVIK